MRVVALCGSGNVGKTETLKELIHVCSTRGATKICSRPCATSAGDVIEVFDYKGQRICVTTCGDEVAAINNGHSLAVAHSCNVFVTAARGQLNCPTLARVCALAGMGNYPILLSAYWERSLHARMAARNARVDALLRCL